MKLIALSFFSVFCLLLGSCSKKSITEPELNLLKNESKKNSYSDFTDPTGPMFGATTQSETIVDDQKATNALVANGM